MFVLEDEEMVKMQEELSSLKLEEEELLAIGNLKVY